MTEILSNIEKISYKKLDQLQYVDIRGYAVYSDGKPFVPYVQINGETWMDFKFQRINQPDVEQQLFNYFDKRNTGLQVAVSIPAALTIDRVTLLDDQNQVFAEIDKKQLKKNRDHKIFQYHIDNVIQLLDGGLNISGWAIAFQNSPAVSISNDSGKVIPAKIQRLKRVDLQEMDFCAEDAQPGFTIEIPSEYVNQKLFLNLELLGHSQRLMVFNPHFFFAYNFTRKFSRARIKKGLAYLQTHSLKQTVKRVFFPASFVYDAGYDLWFRRHEPDERTLQVQRNTTFSYSPKISVVVAAYNTYLPYLQEMIESVLNQTYSRWQLCIADGSTNEEVAEYIKKHYNREERIVYTRLEGNYGISENTNCAIRISSGDYIGFFDHDDLLTPDCLFELVSSLQNTHHDLIYTDEDKLNDLTKLYDDPHIKPDFAPECLRSYNYITHFTVVSRDLLEQTGLLNPACDGSQDHDFVLRATEKAKSVHHIPKVLYHWRMHPSSTAMNPESKLYCYQAGQKAIQDQLDRLGIKGYVEFPAPFYGTYRVHYELDEMPLVSIIIPNKDHVEDLKRCIESIYEKSTYTNFEILIAENNSQESRTFEYYKTLKSTHPNLKIISYQDVFNFSKINNEAVRQAAGDYLLFLNNDTKMIRPESIQEMLSQVVQPGIGAVGARLLFPDYTIQHAGVIVGYKNGAAHCFHKMPSEALTYKLRGNVIGNFSAVSAACLMISKKHFLEVGGFDENLAVALNDVDLCLTLQQKGLRIVYTPYSLWFHYESKTRGLDLKGPNARRYEEEKKYFASKWPEQAAGKDPYYSPVFTGCSIPFKKNWKTD